MFANSPICDGQLNGYRSFREHIWTDTDKNRSGLLNFAFLPDASFAHYVEYALDVPMYFIIRHHDYIDMTGTTFRQYLALRLSWRAGDHRRLGRPFNDAFPRDANQALYRNPLGRQPAAGFDAGVVGAYQRRVL